MSDENYISLQEATFHTGLKYREVYQLAQAGKIRSRRDEAGNLHVARADVLAYKPQAESASLRPQTQPPQSDGRAIALPSNANLLHGRYRLEPQPIGDGGYGAVYRAQHLEMERTVAIKQLTHLPAAGSFKREAQTLFDLHHQGLPRVIDYFAEGGHHYLVMEYIEGENLSQWVKQRGPIAETQALAWAKQILNTLDYLHRQRIIHRDVKPANVIIRDGSGQAMLVDLGIARIGDYTYPAEARSPYFSPPEQTSPDIDVRADIYGLGATLYFALTGLWPLDASDRIGGEALTSPRAANPGLSAATEHVIMRAMAVNRADRWPDARTLRDALPTGSSDIATAVTG